MENVSEIIRCKVSDPRIGFISITDVETTPDISLTRIFVSVLGSDQQKIDTMAGLKSATHFIRGELGNRLSLRVVPEIVFKLDTSLARGDKVLGIMKGLGKDDRKTKAQ
jgi:ribosome-binding factor A